MHDYQRTMQLNYFAPVQLMLTLLPGMRERGFGTVVNVSSIGVLTRVPRFGAYVASKAALDMLCDTWQAETHSEDVRFCTVHMSLVRTPMIEATTIYQRFPVLTPDQAGEVICEAIVKRPRRVSPPFGQLAAFADAMSPSIMDRVRSQGFQLFADSAAARGEVDVLQGAGRGVRSGPGVRGDDPRRALVATRDMIWPRWTHAAIGRAPIAASLDVVIGARRVVTLSFPG